jgi:cytochrome c553
MTPLPRMKRGVFSLATSLALFALVALLAGCREDMQVQPRIDPLARSDLFEDGRAARPLIEGTIARGHLRTDTYFYTGRLGNQDGDVMPFPVTREVLDRGRERFDIYCAPCHARTGDGNGMIVQRGYRRPPSYHIDRLRNAPLGHFFDVMTNGFGAMPDYAAQVSPYDRWTIVAYIRALQFSQNAPAALVPAGTRLPSGAPPISGTPGSGATPAQAEPASGNLSVGAQEARP